LLRILNEKEFKELDSLTDWICMSCHLQESHFSPSLESSDWSIVKPAIGNASSNNIYFSKSNIPRLKLPNSLVEKSAARKKSHGAVDEIDLKYCPEESCLPSTFSPRGDTARSPLAASKNMKASTSHKEIPFQRELLVKKEVVSGVVSVPEDLPYLDDFDDGSSSEEERLPDNVDDDDCNLLITLPSARFSPMKNGAKKKSLTNIKSKKSSDCILSEIVPRKRLKNMQRDVETEISSTISGQNASTRGSKKGSKRSKAAELESRNGAALPPVNTAVDEVYYFSQYVQVCRILSLSPPIINIFLQVTLFAFFSEYVTLRNCSMGDNYFAAHLHPALRYFPLQPH
jgi:hypothetical protein